MNASTTAPPDDTSPLRVGPYDLVPVLSIRQDDLASLFGHEPGVYVCNGPEPAWYERFGLVRKFNTSVEKKRRMFASLPAGSHWVSPTFDATTNGPTEDFRAGSVLHLGHGAARGRLAQLRQAAKVARWLFTRRDEYAFVHVYNFDLPNYLAPLAAKYLLGKRLYVDYEDDYTVTGSLPKRLAERVLRRTVTGVVCVNEGMEQHFRGKDVRVFNAFADLSYLAGMRTGFFEGMRLLYSGSLDDIRGADLVPDLVAALRTRLKQFTIRLSGDGPLRSVVESWRFPEVEYVGFLNDEDYAQELAAADACLLLQKPDHPFSKGSFPSKIDAYAKHRKPILMLVEAR